MDARKSVRSMIWHLVLIGKGVVMNSNEMASGSSIVHRAAWRGAELADSDFWEMKLPEHWMDPADSLSEAKWYADIQRELGKKIEFKDQTNEDYDEVDEEDEDDEEEEAIALA